jgi:hypothetical protein
MAHMPQHMPLSELKQGFAVIEQRLAAVRELCSGEPDFEHVIKELKAIRQSLAAASKILQRIYISRHVLEQANSGVTTRCVSDMCERLMACRAEALREEQKIFFQGQIPSRGNGNKEGLVPAERSG